MLEKSVQNKIDLWLNGSYDAETKSQLQNLVNSEKFTELTDAFYKDLEFGGKYNLFDFLTIRE